MHEDHEMKLLMRSTQQHALEVATRAAKYMAGQEDRVKREIQRPIKKYNLEQSVIELASYRHKY